MGHIHSSGRGKNGGVNFSPARVSYAPPLLNQAVNMFCEILGTVNVRYPVAILKLLL